MATKLCSCCRREMKADVRELRCWECRGRPKTEGHVVPPAGKRDPSCPHELPETVI